MKQLRSMTYVALMLLLVTSGCIFDSSSSKNDADKFIGRWEIFDLTAGPNPSPWYVVFSNDGSWYFSTSPNGGPDGSGMKTYFIDGDTLIGGFTNPNAGDGRIEAKVSGNEITIDFIEYWHTPHKVVPYAGTRM
jgi:hypothetical protein